MKKQQKKIQRKKNKKYSSKPDNERIKVMQENKSWKQCRNERQKTNRNPTPLSPKPSGEREAKHRNGMCVSNCLCACELKVCFSAVMNWFVDARVRMWMCDCARVCIFCGFAVCVCVCVYVWMEFENVCECVRAFARLVYEPGQPNSTPPEPTGIGEKT